MRAEGFEAVVERSLDMRYAGQGYELNIPATGDFVARFHAAHRNRYGHADKKRPVEIVNVRARLVARTQKVPLTKQKLRKGNGRRAIVRRRREEPIRTAAQLAELVRRCVPRSRHARIDPATRTFQALRIAANDELGELDAALRALPECLAPHGRLAIISFHSLEDRRVKNAFRDDGRLAVLAKKPIRPSAEETARNPRARSAKMRVAERKQATWEE